MFPWKSVINIQSPCSTPVYLQIANAIICQVREGRVQPGARLPGTRALSKLLSVHRKTVVASYEELDAQGWIEIHASKGAFVNHTLPEKKPQELRVKRDAVFAKLYQTGFEVEPYTNVHDPTNAPLNMPGLHDGPDMRLMPRTLIGRTFKSVLNRSSVISHLRYTDVEGNINLRKILSAYLNESRGLQTTFENILITRGSQMGFFLTGSILLKPGDLVLTGDPGYYYAEQTFTHFGATLVRVPVDEFGLQTEVIETICKKNKVRMLYVTPHHHYPTTVTLSAARRMELLDLSVKYGFIILEDDYDYDFHYQSNPLLPLASADANNMVIYTGSLSKSLAPYMRVGFLVVPENLRKEIVKVRQLIDIQGDYVLEQTIAELFRLGEIKRHMKKALKIYQQRRDFFCQLLEEKMDGRVQFRVPEGGMSVWAQFDPAIPLPEFTNRVRKHGWVISNGQIHDKVSTKKWNATRLGFAIVNEKEIETAMNVIERAVRTF